MIRNICANWASVGINLVVAFVMSPFLVHALGDSRYGLWVLVLSVTGYMGLLDSGLRVSIVKHTAECNARGDVDGLNRILFTALSLYGSLGAVVVLASFVSSFFFEHIFAVAPADVPVGRVLTVIAGLNVALSLPLGVFGSLLAGLQRYDRLTSSGIIVLVLRTIAIVVAVKSGMGLITLGWIHVASQLLSGAILFHMAAREFPQLSLYPRRLERATVRALYSYSGFILLNNVATFLLFYSGEVLIGMFIGAAEVTVYAIARSLVQYLSTIIGSMAQVFHPYASDQHARGNPGAVLDALIMGTKSSLLIALPIGVAFVIVGPTFIGLWMGAEYGRSAGLLLAWLTVPQIVWLSQSTATNILLGVGAPPDDRHAQRRDRVGGHSRQRGAGTGLWQRRRGGRCCGADSDIEWPHPSGVDSSRGEYRSQRLCRGGLPRSPDRRPAIYDGLVRHVQALAPGPPGRIRAAAARQPVRVFPGGLFPGIQPD